MYFHVNYFQIEFYNTEELEEGEIPSFNVILIPEEDIDNYIESEIEIIDSETDDEDAKPLVELVEKKIDEEYVIEENVFIQKLSLICIHILDHQLKMMKLYWRDRQEKKMLN